MHELKTNIRNLRKAWGLTQKELGEAIHVASNTVAMYEKGDRVPTVDILQDIASFLCVTVDQLIHEDFSGLDIQPTLITTETGISYVKNLFPIIQSDSAMSDIHFRKGYLFSLNFWNRSLTILRFCATIPQTKTLPDLAAPYHLRETNPGVFLLTTCWMAFAGSISTHEDFLTI